MEYKPARSALVTLTQQVKVLLGGIGALLVCNALLGALLWHQSGRQAVVLIPAELHEKAVITPDSVSASYLEAMALMLVNARLNTTPETVVGNNQQLLRFADSRFYVGFKQQLRDEAEAIQAGKIAATFYIQRVQSYPARLTVVVEGSLKRWVGIRALGTDRKRYALGFSKSGTVLLLKSFQELKKSGAQEK